MLAARQASHEMPVWELSIEIDPSRADAAGAALVSAGAAGIEERERDGKLALIVWTESRHELEAFAAAVRELGSEPVIRELDDAWRTEWMRHLRQERVCEGFVVQPLGDETPAPAGARCILFDPAQAFGVGSHATTRLAARAVEDACRRRPGTSVLDVGTGTGVLAIIAACSGAREVVGIDVDPAAVAAARKNAELNQVAGACSFSSTPLREIGREFDIVVANVEAPAQRELAVALVGATRRAGTLIVTGFLVERKDELAALFGLPVSREQHEDDWCLLALDNTGESC